MTTGKIGFILLAIWLILYGMSGLFHLTFESMGIVMALLALVSGICIGISQLK